VTRQTAAASARPGLLRVLGRWDLLALVINGIVGAGIFGLPAKVHALLGLYGLLAILVCAGVIGLVILCFAEVASRFNETGGPYVYASTAFGPVVGFLTGWLFWVARVAGGCAICSLLLQYIAYFDPALNQGLGRAMTAAGIIGALVAINYFGIGIATMVANGLTFGKLAALLIFVTFGLMHINPAAFNDIPLPSTARFAQSVLLLTFAFVGWESVVVLAGEARNPQRDLPIALVGGVCAVGILYFFIQLVCIGTLPQLAASERPIVDASRLFIGPAGATLITIGAVLSMVGTLSVTMLTISRMPYAIASAGQLPGWLAAVHPRYRTPHVAVLVSGMLVLGLTLSSSFVYLLTVSAIARLLVFAVGCASLPKLRRMPAVRPACFAVPGGALFPCAALLLIAWLLASSSWAETFDVAMLSSLGAIFYALGRWRARRMR